MPVGFSIAHFVGWTATKRGFCWLGRNLREVVRFSPGFRFYSSRDALEHRSDFDEFIGSATTIDAVFSTGKKFITYECQNYRRIRRLILPDPCCESFRFYEMSMGQQNVLSADILEATKRAREFGIDVRWSPIFIQCAFMISDVEKSSAWLHCETVLPFSKENKRPSFTATKNRFAGTVLSYRDIFEKMWSISSCPARGETDNPQTGKMSS